MLGLLGQVDTNACAKCSGYVRSCCSEKNQRNLSTIAYLQMVTLQSFSLKPLISELKSSAPLSMANTRKDSIQTRKIAILAADGVNGTSLQQMKKALIAEGAVPEVIAPKLGGIKAANGSPVKVDKNLLTVSSVLYDAVYVPGGEKKVLRRYSMKPMPFIFINQGI